MPLLAVVQLDATAGQVSLLMAAGYLPQALLALHAGAWADRKSKRRQIVIGDLVGAAAVVTVPIGAAADMLTLDQLIAVAAVQSGAAVARDAAAVSYLPTLVDRRSIQSANGIIGAFVAVAGALGIIFGATLATILGPARALILEVLSRLVSVWCTHRISSPLPESRPTPAGRLRNEIADGLRYVRDHDTLRTLTLLNSTLVFALVMSSTLWVLHMVQLGLGVLALGLIMGIGAFGAATGSLLSPRLTARYGSGATMLGALALAPLTQIPVLLAGAGSVWQVAIGGAFFLQQACTNLVGITQRSIRQSAASDSQQARMLAVNTFLTTVSSTLATLLAGALGTWVGIRATLAVGPLLLTVPLAILLFSPLRSLRMLEEKFRI